MKLKAGYGLDSNGFIVSDVSINKINPSYLPCIHEAVDCLRKQFQSQLQSVYVYGSVARGEAVIAKSDLDLIAMFNSKLSSVQLTKIKELAGKLSQAYRTLVRDVGIAVADYDYTIDPANYYENAFLKELSVCVYGEDLRNRFGPYQLTSEIAIRFNGDIGEVLTRTLTRLKTDSNENFKETTKGFARKLIRTYYSMVMVRSKIWTTRLHEQAEVAIYYYPHKEPVIRTLLNWIEEQPADRETVRELFRSEGTWASANFIHEVNIS